jgi:hypothetical protein
LPVLAFLLVNMLGVVATFLAKYLTQKLAVTLIVVAQLVVLFGAFYLGARALLATIGHASSNISPMFGAGVQMIISQRTATGLSAFLVFWVACELFKWRFTIIQLWGRVI